MTTTTTTTETTTTATVNTTWGPVRVAVTLQRRLPCFKATGVSALVARQLGDRLRDLADAAGSELPRTRILVDLVPGFQDDRFCRGLGAVVRAGELDQAILGLIADLAA